MCNRHGFWARPPRTCDLLHLPRRFVDVASAQRVHTWSACPDQVAESNGASKLIQRIDVIRGDLEITAPRTHAWPNT